MKLLGRAHECAALKQLADQASSEASRTLIIRGAPGAGKSTLLNYLRDRLEHFHVLSANGVESEMDLPYSGLHQLCAPLLEAHLPRLPVPQGSALATALGLAHGTAPDRFLVGLATLSLLANAADKQPVAAVVDDGHWLDPASAQVLAFVGRRLSAERVALVCTVRTGMRPEDDDVLGGLPEMMLGPLSDTDARALLLNNVYGPVDPAVVDQILRECRGNPLALMELPRTWRPSDLAGGFGLLDTRGAAQRIQRSYLRRFADLPAPTQLLVLTAAAEPLGDPLLLARAAELLGTNLSDALPAADAALMEVSDRVRFAHPLARSAIYEDATTEQRHRVHGALAAATDSDVDPDRRAWHRARASTGPDEDVAGDLERSANRAQARGGLSAAAAFLTVATERTPSAARRARRALDAAAANIQAGAFDTARKLLAIADSYPLPDAERVRQELLGAQLAMTAGRGNTAAQFLLDAAHRLEPMDASRARETYLDAFTASLFGARLNDGLTVRDVAAAAAAAPQPAPDRARTPDVLLEAYTAFTRGYEEAIPAARRALGRLHADMNSPEAELRWFWHGTVLALELWDDQAAYDISLHQVRTARKTGALSQLALALSSHITMLVFRGDTTAAQLAVAESRSVEDITGVRSAPYGAVKLNAWLGLEEETKELVDRTVRDATARGEGIGVAVAQYSLAYLCNALGQYDQAMDAAWASASEPTEMVVQNWALVELVESAVRCGNLDLALQAQDRLAARARASATNWALGVEAQSGALLTTGDDAQAHYLSAIEHLGRTKVRADLARAHLVYGEWLRRADRPAEARYELTTAYDAFTTLGGRAFADRARGELAATGLTIHPPETEPVDDLNAQELHIAQLAQEGLSNNEIGAQLFLSARTVEWHLRKVFKKLGIRSRRQLHSALTARERAVLTEHAVRDR